MSFLPRPVHGTIPIWVALREEPATPYDFVAAIEPGTDPAPYVAAGATWCVTDVEAEGLTLDRMRGMIGDGPLR